MPWIREEVAKVNELDEGDIINFDSIGEAEKLVKQHKEKNSNGSFPVMFLEPGDLILETDWGSSHDGTVRTAIVLRKRN